MILFSFVEHDAALNTGALKFDVVPEKEQTSHVTPVQPSSTKIDTQTPSAPPHASQYGKSWAEQLPQSTERRSMSEILVAWGPRASIKINSPSPEPPVSIFSEISDL